MKYTQIPADTFEKVQLNAGVLVKSFDVSTGAVLAKDIIGATSGGVSFSAATEYSDFGDDIDNCPTNTMELKKLDTVAATMSGSFVTADASVIKMLVAAADETKVGEEESSVGKITPRRDLDKSDFVDIWWVGDYSDVNTGDTAGFIAIHMINSLNTGGFSIQSSDKAKGTFSFEFTAHFSIKNIDQVPYEIYIRKGE